MHDMITIRGARLHNLKNIALSIPKNKLVVLTGLSGSGKSTLVFDTLHKEAMRQYFESVGEAGGYIVAGVAESFTGRYLARLCGIFYLGLGRSRDMLMRTPETL